MVLPCGKSAHLELGWAVGAGKRTIILLEEGVHVSIPTFDPGTVLDVIEAEGVTASVKVPTMIGMMFAHESYRPERLATMRQLAYGASPMPDAILDRLLSELPDVELIQGYGMTEFSATLSLLLPEDHVPGTNVRRT